MSLPAVLIVFLFGVLIGIGVTALYADRRDLARRLSDLEAANRKLMDANRKHLPLNTMEDLEHAKAAWILAAQEIEDKRLIMENLGAWLDLARQNKRAGE